MPLHFQRRCLILSSFTAFSNLIMQTTVDIQGMITNHTTNLVPDMYRLPSVSMGSSLCTKSCFEDLVVFIPFSSSSPAVCTCLFQSSAYMRIFPSKVLCTLIVSCANVLTQPICACDRKMRRFVVFLAAVVMKGQIT